MRKTKKELCQYVKELCAYARELMPEAKVWVRKYPFETEDAAIIIEVPTNRWTRRVERAHRALDRRADEILMDNGYFIVTLVWQTQDEAALQESRTGNGGTRKTKKKKQPA